MQVVSEQFKTAIADSGRVLTARLSFAGGTHVVETDQIQSIEVDHALIPSNDFEIGTAPMGTAKITLYRNEHDDFNYETSKVKIYLGIEIVDDDLTYVEEVTLGSYTIEEATVRDDFITLKAVDNMHKAEKQFTGTVAFPATPLSVLQAACLDAGITLSTMSFPNSGMSIADEVSFFNVTNRQMIAAVAELAGGYALIDPVTDTLVIKHLGGSVQQVITDENYFEFDKNESGISSINKIIVKVGEVQASQGDGDAIYSVVNNILVQNPNLPVAALYSTLNGIHFTSGKIRWQGNFALELCDKVTVDGDTFYILNRTISFTGGLRETINTPAASNVVKDSSVRGSLTLDMRETKTQIKLMDGQIEFAIDSVGNLGVQHSNLRQTVNSLSAEISMLSAGNIISNPLGDFGTMDWTFESSPWLAKANPPHVALSSSIIRTAFNSNGEIMYPVVTDTPAGSGFMFWHAGKALSKAAAVEGGGEYSLYTRYKGGLGLTFKLRQYTVTEPSNKGSYSKETTLGTTSAVANWTTLSNTLTLDVGTKSVVLVVESSVNVYNSHVCTFTETSFNMGAPRPYAESLANVNTKAEYARTLAEQTEAGFLLLSSSVTNIDGRLITAESQLDVQSDQISTRVRKDGVISAINQTAEVIKIHASKLTLDGYVTVTSLSGVGTTTIDGSNIKTGTIDAARLNVSKLSSLSSDLGDITGGSINIGSGKFAVSSLGTVVATSVTITGKVTANNQSSISGSLNSVTGTTGAISGTSFSGWTYGNHSSGYHSGITYAGSGTLGAVNFTSFTGGVRLQGAMQPNTIQTQSPAASNSIAGNLTVYGTFSNPSDRRLKEDIKPINKKDIVDGVYGVDLVTFKFKDREGYHLGVISNDVIDRQPSEFTKYTIYPNDDGYLLADYQTMSVMGLAAIQDLNERVRKLEKKR